MLLDGSGEDTELFRLVAESRAFADPLSCAGPTRYIVPSAPKVYDVDAHFAREGDILWHQPKGVKVGDIVYIYYGSPVSAVRWRCEVVGVSLSGEKYDDPRPQMLLHPTTRYPDDFCTFARLGELGIRAVRGTRRVGGVFAEYMDSFEKGK